MLCRPTGYTTALVIFVYRGAPLSSFYHKTFQITYTWALEPSLNVQGRCLTLSNGGSVGLDGSGHFSGSELLDLLGSAANESAGVQESVQLGDDGLEEGGAADTLNQVVVLALLLDIVGSLVGENT